jgi:hypothetical protein
VAVTYPLIMPPFGVGRQSFELRRFDFLSPEASGRLGGVSAGEPLWAAKWTLADMTPGKADQWGAFVELLDGPLRQFYGYDHARLYPKAYPNGFDGVNRAGGGAFDGAATTWAVDGTGAVLTLTGLPANAVLSVRDYVGFRWTTGGLQRRALVRCAEKITANGAGSASVTVRPAVPTVVPPGAVAYLDKPTCLMRLVPGGVNVGDMDPRRALTGEISAMQDLLP